MTQGTKRSEMKESFAKKSFGQNFLVDQNVISRIISALDPQPGETIIEIGAGRGALTELLIESGARVIAIELERDMVALLSERFGNSNSFSLIEADALKIDFASLLQEHQLEPQAKLVANLPYYISTAILQNLIAQRETFSEMILMFQREVVDRITAAPNSKERGYLTVLVDAYLETVRLFDVSPQSFAPVPKVRSSIVRMVRKETLIESGKEDLFRELISLSFSQKRKTLQNNLKNAGAPISGRIAELGGVAEFLSAAGIQPNRRAESLTTQEWLRLLRIIS